MISEYFVRKELSEKEKKKETKINPTATVKSHKLLNWTEPSTTILDGKERKKEEGRILDRRLNRSSS